VETSAFKVILLVGAGLSLFFVGYKILSDNLKRLTGKRLRKSLNRISGNVFIGAVSGVASGLLMASAGTVAFVLAGFVQGQFLRLKSSYSILIWSNLGGALVISLTILPIDLFVLALLFFSGILWAFEFPKSSINLVGAILGFALLLFGLNQIGSITGFLRDLQWVNEMLVFSQRYILIGIPIGFFLCFTMQSVTAVLLITLTLASGGLLSFPQVMTVFLGAQFGLSLSCYVPAIGFRGEPKQTVMAFVFYQIIAASITTLIYLADHFTGFRFLETISSQIGISLSEQFVYLVVIYHLIFCLLFSLIKTPFTSLIEKWYPRTNSEELSVPKYLPSTIIAELDTILVMVFKEQNRLLSWLPDYCSFIEENRDVTIQKWEDIHSAFANVSEKIENALSEGMGSRVDASLSEKLINLQKKQNLITDLENSVYTLVKEYPKLDVSQTKELTKSIIEAALTHLLTYTSYLQEWDEMDLEHLILITDSQENTMKTIRQKYLAVNQNNTKETGLSLLHITNIFERFAWTMNQLVRLEKQLDASDF
jgi:phosphate:Na+ symporter